MKMIAALLVAMTSAPAYASYLESCDFAVTVLETASAPVLDGTVTQYTRLAKVGIESAANQGSHSPAACSERVGTEQWLVLREGLNVEVGQMLAVDYFYVNGMTPDGVKMSERWTILEGQRGGLAYSCHQEGTEEPTFSVYLRHPVGPVPAFGTYYSVYVRTEESSYFAAESLLVRFSQDPNGAQIRMLSQDGFILRMEADLDLGRNLVVADATLVLEDGLIQRDMRCVRAYR